MKTMNRKLYPEHDAGLETLIWSPANREAIRLAEDAKALVARLSGFVNANPVNGQYDRAAIRESRGSEDNGPCMTFLAMAKTMEVLLQEVDRILIGLRPEDLEPFNLEQFLAEVS